MTFVLAKILGFCSGKPPLEPGIGKNPGLLHRSSLSKDRVPNVGVMGRFEMEAAIA